MAASVWSLVVEEGAPEFIESYLGPALRRHDVAAVVERADTIIEELSQQARLDESAF